MSIKLQPGDYVSTVGMTEDQYHKVCKAFIDAGADRWEYGRLTWDWYLYWGWHKDYGKLFATDRPCIVERELTIQQVLGEDKMDLQEASAEGKVSLEEAYRIMQANCGIEVGDTVKVLRKAKDYESGWGNCTPGHSTMAEMIGKNLKVLAVDPVAGIRLDTSDINGGAQKLPFFVLELVKKTPKLPEPIRISSEYKARFREDGGIDVGCQRIDFNTLEKVYLTAKSVLEV